MQLLTAGFRARLPPLLTEKQYTFQGEREARRSLGT